MASVDKKDRALRIAEAQNKNLDNVKFRVCRLLRRLFFERNNVGSKLFDETKQR